ncbi:MAG: DUF2085 domain-containing protein [Pyrinomonadaceae bacterium]|nr:DUF2085 domain-containing protein [Pyrinomonadaceae bacterium]
MPELIENYVPQFSDNEFRSRAFKAWGMGLAAVSIWNLVIIAPPLLASAGANSAANSIFYFFGFLCHQIPERSFEVLGHHFAVCVRCFGVYFGLIVGFLIYPLIRNIEEIEPFPRVWLFLSLVPIGVDWLLGMLDIWQNTFLSRFVTGAILGAACAIFIIPAIVELSQMYQRKKLFRVA